MSKKAIFVSAFLFVFALAFGAAMVVNFSNVKSLVANSQIDFQTSPPVQTSTDLKGLNDAFVEISKIVTPSVVFIDVTGKAKQNNEEMDKNFQFFFGPDMQMPDNMPQHGSGSGVIISKDGYIITNNHVVSKADESGIKVILSDKREYTAKLVGTDPNTDIAVIKIDADNLTVSSVGNSDNVQVGQWVLAIGNPMGLNNTVTAGIVSALGRNINIDGNSYAINNFIQTDAVINPGNSGGALVDINGLVVGINAAIKTTTGYYQGYGFAIPINIAKNVASELIKNGKIERGYIGVSIKDVDSKEAKGLGLEKARGVLIQNVIKGGAGDDAGLKTGDIVFSVDGKDVNAANELQTIIGSKRPGETALLVVYRDGKTMDFSVKLKPRTDDLSVNNNPQNENKEETASTIKKFESLGLIVTDLTEAARKLNEVEYGVLVKDVAHFSEAFNRGLRSGYVIVEADKKPVRSISDLEDVLSGKSKGDVVVFKVATQMKDIRLVAIEIQ
ncbi:MAG: Do family serine endopeptidase [Ignavibacteria bacterium]